MRLVAVFLTPCRSKRLWTTRRVFTCIIHQTIKYTIHYSTALFSWLIYSKGLFHLLSRLPGINVFSRVYINLYPLGSKLVKSEYHRLTLNSFGPVRHAVALVRKIGKVVWILLSFLECRHHLAYGGWACSTCGSQKLCVLPKRHENSLFLRR